MDKDFSSSSWVWARIQQGYPSVYYPELCQLTGSMTAGIFLSRVLHWWSKNDGQSFWKMNTSKGDDSGRSWVDQDGFTENELRTARGKVSTRVKKSKIKQHLAISPDLLDYNTKTRSRKIQGEIREEVISKTFKGLTKLVVYWKNIGGKMWYMLNEPLLMALLLKHANPQRNNIDILREVQAHYPKADIQFEVKDTPDDSTPPTGGEGESVATRKKPQAEPAIVEIKRVPVSAMAHNPPTEELPQSPRPKAIEPVAVQSQPIKQELTLMEPTQPKQPTAAEPINEPEEQPAAVEVTSEETIEYEEGSLEQMMAEGVPVIDHDKQDELEAAQRALAELDAKLAQKTEILQAKVDETINFNYGDYLEGQSKKVINAAFQEATAFALGTDPGGFTGRYVNFLTGKANPPKNPKRPPEAWLHQLHDDKADEDLQAATPVEITACRIWYAMQTTEGQKRTLPHTFELLAMKFQEFRASFEYDRFMELGHRKLRHLLVKELGPVMPEEEPTMNIPHRKMPPGQMKPKDFITEWFTTTMKGDFRL